MVSDELLSKVLEIDCAKVYGGVWTDYPKTNRISSDIKFKYTGHEELEYINMYELAFKIKEYITEYTNNEIDLNEAFKDIKFYFRIAEDLVKDEV